jgi:protein-disulfide isomerase
LNRIGSAFVAVAVALTGGVACQREDPALTQKLDQMSERLAAIDSKLDRLPAAGAAAAAQQPPRPRPGQPSPTAVYAVPIAKSAAIGAKHAKVTIVEAFTFT